MELNGSAQPASADIPIHSNIQFDREGFLQSYRSPLSTHYYSYLRSSELLMLAEGTVNIMNLTMGEDLDVLFFLDKSARPAGHLFTQTWSRKFPGVQRPNVRYIETGRARREYEDNIEAIIPEIHDRYSALVGKNIGVIDEYVYTGNTLSRAKSLLTKFFPEAEKICASNMFTSTPSWYAKICQLGVMEIGDNPQEDRHFLVKAIREDDMRYSTYTNYKKVREATVGLRRELSHLAWWIADYLVT